MKRNYRFVLAFLALLGFNRSPAQHKQVFVSIDKRPPVGVAALDSAGVVYVSMTDFARTFALPWGRNDTYHKLDVRFSGQRIKFTSQNPFVVITDIASNFSTVYLSPQRILTHDTS